MNSMKMQHEMHLQNRNSSGVMMVGGNGYDNKRRRTGMPGQMVAGGMRQPPYPQYGGNPYGGGYPNQRRGQQVIMPMSTHTGPRPQEDHTLINTFSIKQIEEHIQSLNKGLQIQPNKLKKEALMVLKGIIEHEDGWVFNSAVNVVELGLVDYFQVIKRPMDLGSIKKRLENNVYRKLEDFEEDVLLVFENAMTYNAGGSVVYKMADELRKKFRRDYRYLTDQLEQIEENKRNDGNTCVLCAGEKLLYEPPVFYCNGANCPAKRIRRNSYYYVTANNQYHWCATCFTELKENSPVQMSNQVIRKSELSRKRHDEQGEEPWVECDKCHRWIHQICGLFNTRQNKHESSEYTCPKCTIKERQESGKAEPTSTTPGAEDLPRTKLSEYLETHVKLACEERFAELAREKSAVEGISLSEATEQIGGGGAITIRQVTSMNRTIETRERMKARYAFKNYPAQFEYRCKCLIVFQKIEGVDVMLFGLYVYEHDEKNPAPNTRCVYVSYLDSVHYMRPRKIRTFVYHELLIAYLDYVRQRGYATAHIWACPPLKGDDYVLYAKPEEQKTPKDQQLRQWYINMLETCTKRGIVKNVTNMHEQYFSKPELDATVIPYLEGDYWVGEAENVIKELSESPKESKKNKNKANNDQANKSKLKAKKKDDDNSRSGTRSTGLDEEALIASGIVDAPEKSLEEGGRDQLMVKLGETIHPMKDSFIVAFLDWEEATKARDAEVVIEKAAEEKKAAEAKRISEKKVKEEEEKAKKRAEEEEEKAKKEEKEKGGEGGEKKEGDGKGEEADGKDDETTPKIKEEMVDDGAEVNVKKEKDEDGDGDGDDDMDVDEARKSKKKNSPVGRAKRGAKKEEEEDETVEEDETMEEEDETVGETPTRSSRRGKKNTSPAKTPASKAKKTVKKAATKKTPAKKTPAKIEPKSSNRNKRKRADDAADENEDDNKDEKNDGDGGKAEEAKDEKKDEKVVLCGTVTEEPEGKEKKDGKKKNEEELMEEEVDPNAWRSGKIRDIRKTVRNTNGDLTKVIDDDVEDLDCDFLNNRQEFLNLCQGNHYQFDELRRAKHTSMMVLWHLHNRDAQKFVQQCAYCSREILVGYRYNCPTCNDFDLCQECVRCHPNSHQHILKPIPIAQQAQLTEQQRKDRQRSINLHMQLLQHAATCDSSANCPSNNCNKMKGLLKHGAECTKKAQGGCSICKRISALLHIHARQCKIDNCPVPSCTAIRERARQIFKQQAAMDDRRRQAMNVAYRR